MEMTAVFKQYRQHFFSRLTVIISIQLLGLTVLLLLALIQDLQHGKESVRTLAEATAETIARDETLYRDFFSTTGGIYLKTGPDITPDPALADRPDRDIVGGDGSLYSLIIPAKILSRVHAKTIGNHGVKPAIKTFHPLGPEDTPDTWEKRALSVLRQDEQPFSEVVTEDGENFLRFIYPLYATESCLLNRIHEKLKAGDLLGGISIRLPMARFRPLLKEHNRLAYVRVILLWLLGLAGIFWTARLLRKRDCDLRNSQRKVLRSKEELEKTFNAIGDVITIQNGDMRIRRINKAGCRILQKSEEEILGKYCFEVFRGNMEPCAGCPELSVLQDKETQTATIKHANMKKSFAVSVAPLLDENEEVNGIVHCAKDITDNLELERQLRQAQKMEAIGTLAGGIAHDFNNILSAILGFAELAKQDLSPESGTAEDLRNILAAGLRAKDLVQQILTFSRQGEQKYQPLMVAAIVKEAIKLLRASIPSTIEIRDKINDSCGKVIADPSQVHQVVMNLGTNAYHAMQEEGGILEITLDPVILTEMDVKNKIALTPGSYLRLVISDTGKGMQQRIQERIFEPYFTTKAKGEGTGLGLSVVHGIVEGMGGTITVYSEVNQGTTFHVYLPVSTDSSVPQRNLETNEHIPHGNERILLIDDEEMVLLTERRILESLGYKVTGFIDSNEAKDVFLTAPDNFDLLFTDIYMPQTNGIELAKRFREVRADLPIIMCTGFSERMSEENRKAMGIDAVIMKPLTVKELASAVRTVFDRRKKAVQKEPPKQGIPCK